MDGREVGQAMGGLIQEGSRVVGCLLLSVLLLVGLLVIAGGVIIGMVCSR